MPIYAGCGAILQLDANGNGIFDPSADIASPTALIFKSTDGGESWQWLGDWQNAGVPAYCDTLSDVSMMNALYDNMVEVNPLDPDDVVVGGNANYSTYWPDPADHPTRMLAIPWRGFVYRIAGRRPVLGGHDPGLHRLRPRYDPAAHRAACPCTSASTRRVPKPCIRTSTAPSSTLPTVVSM